MHMSTLLIFYLLWLSMGTSSNATWDSDNYYKTAYTVTPLDHDEVLFANFTLVVDGLSKQKGALRIAIFNSEYDYPDSPTVAEIIRVEDTLVEWRVNNLAYGNYAIAVYHDANENGELDTNFLGIPTERYGFSNGARGKFGPATWDQAKFTISHRLESHRITLE